MSEKDDAQASDPEAGRVAQAYAAYGADPRRAASWSAENPGNLAIRREVIDALWRMVAPHAAGGVLDVGCGTGWWLEELAQRVPAGARLAGLDILEARVAAARQRCPEADVRAGDARALPWADGSFGAVTMLLALSAMGQRDNARRALREARRVLAPGGLVVVWEPRLPAPRGGRLTIPRRLLRDELAPVHWDFTVTLMPAVARQLGPNAAARWYPQLARLRPLRSHRIVAGPQN
jgi:ubiquinone/menaquinone biosynthesis C-methylase UbiE